MMISRAFKGVWLPRFLYLDPRFSWSEKILLCEIDSLDVSEKGCYASNAYLAAFLGLKNPKTVSNMVSSLIDRGCVAVVWRNGPKRGLRSLIHRDTDGGDKGAPGKTVGDMTAYIIGVVLPTPLIERINRRINSDHADAWLMFAGDRAAGLDKKDRRRVVEKVGYWLTDFDAHSKRGYKSAPTRDIDRADICDNCRGLGGFKMSGTRYVKCDHKGDESDA